MDTHSFKLASLILAASLLGFAGRAAAEPRPSVNVVLHVCDDPDIHWNLVSRAKDEMGRIFRDAGIDIAWTDQDSMSTGPDDPPPASSVPQLTLVILCRDLTEELTVDETALGGAVGTRDYRGHVAYVFYDRVERYARTSLNVSRDPETDDLYSVILLAHTMAHEVGHLLLPYGHSATGLMRAEWDAKDMRLAVEQRLNFTPEQAEVIRGRIVARAGDTRSPASN